MGYGVQSDGLRTLASGTALASTAFVESKNHPTFSLLAALVVGACSNADMMNDGPSAMLGDFSGMSCIMGGRCND